jgi:PAS domain S-box-containing protein
VSRRILFVEDYEPTARLEARRIGRHDYDVVIAGDGEEAVRIAAEDASIELVLMDIDLGGGIDGAEAARRILEHRELPVVFLTAYAEQEFTERVRDIPGYGYVLKNSGEYVVVEAVRMALQLFDSLQLTRRREQEYREVVETIREGIWRIDREGYTTFVNSAMARMLGYSVEEMLGASLFAFMDEGQREKAEQLQARRAEGIEEQHEFTFRRKYGDSLTALLSVTPLTDEAGGYTGSLAAVMDITERKREQQQLERALADKEHLMRELNHRVKNNLNMISALVSMKESAAAKAEDLSDIRSQIDAIRLIHEKLHARGNVGEIRFGEYIQELLDAVFSNFYSGRVRVEVDTGGALFTARTVIPLGLLINETATNAIKHGFTAEEEPVFSVQLEKTGGGSHWLLTIANTGRPFPEGVSLQESESLGLRLITSLSAQLEGTVELKKSPQPVFTVAFPVDQEH